MELVEQTNSRALPNAPKSLSSEFQPNAPIFKVMLSSLNANPLDPLATVLSLQPERPSMSFSILA